MYSSLTLPIRTPLQLINSLPHQLYTLSPIALRHTRRAPPRTSDHLEAPGSLYTYRIAGRSCRSLSNGFQAVLPQWGARKSPWVKFSQVNEHIRSHPSRVTGGGLSCHPPETWCIRAGTVNEGNSHKSHSRQFQHAVPYLRLPVTPRINVNDLHGISGHLPPSTRLDAPSLIW